ncbi:SpaH/EbpB family LPXTG-anchored major pilin [Corynebacterium hesseae]|uniref:SpaH/EbpB family LPXTG-anchored major pilin n=1 Tax=Corynebacterium hesseae TaxID=2913502 RepID=UPI0030CBDC66
MALVIKKTAAIAIAAGLTFAGSAGLAIENAAPAAAQVEQPGNEAGYSLTITKRDLNGDNSGTSNGSKLDEAKIPGKTPDTPAGFKFSIIRVTPATGDDKNDASKATPVEGAVKKSGVTDGNGVIEFTGLEEGVYRVSELEVPANSGFVPGPDFLVSVPVTNETGTGLINNVHVYPKNTRAGIEKTVQDKDKHGGQEYTYTISSDIPKAASGEDKLVSYRVEDALDGRLEAPTADKIEVRLGTSWENATKVDSKNYDAVITPAPAKDGKHNINLQFNEDGRALLAEQKAGTKVLTRITTKAPENVEVIPNKAKLYFNNGDGRGEYDRESEEVKTYWGTLNINKVGEDGKTPLQGAEFRLVKCQAGEDGYTQLPNTEALNVNGKSSWTTGKDGKISITGIHATDFADNADDNTLLCAQETKAPTGFQLDERLVPFVIKRTDGGTQTAPNVSGLSNVSNVKVDNLAYSFDLKNKPSDRFLPNTGGMGITALVLAGLAIVGAGVFVARRNAA